MRRRYLAGVVVLVIALSVVVLALRARSPSATPPRYRFPIEVPATATQLSEFKALILRQSHIDYTAWKTGDMRPLATVYYNDPTVEIDSVANGFLKAHPDGVVNALGQMTGGPIGTKTGYLSYSIAFEQYARDGSRAQAVGGIDPTVTIMIATVDGSHASLVYTLEATRLPNSEYHLTLTQVDGQWYISNQWSTGNP